MPEHKNKFGVFTNEVSLLEFQIKWIMFKVMHNAIFFKPVLDCMHVNQVQRSFPTQAAVCLLVCDPGNATACQFFLLNTSFALYSIQPRVLLRLPSEQSVSCGYWEVHYAPKIHSDSNKSFPSTAESHCCTIFFRRRI